MPAEKPLHILTIGGHAADQELAAGLIIAKATRRGHCVTVLSLTPGERGHARLSAEAYAAQKRREAEACCRELGASCIVLDYKDAELPYNDEVAFVVCDYIRALKPDVVITHWQNSIHKDHRHAHLVARDALFYAALPRIERELPAHWVRQVYYSENWEDMEGYTPDLYVEIDEETMAQYDRALAKFELWNGGTGWPYRDYYLSLARMRGCLGGALRWRYGATLKLPEGAKVDRYGGERLPFGA